ncbi:formylglycine-generating enzyme family protein [Synechococcus sp. Cruz-9H2]|uniref:formylglycine-generating enzyme family protein n=1 Tax=unclassified Synechococcus TaxID=2626047 RepID=UPI0020CC76F0|nr:MULTISPECIES: formylglycine-generating enzyme family protein [unclassified Synechococcus]MCP9819811.1 formylglycine-generating enzyme family protein [Synechococcus sp. Cruz-9H2]MCP9844123.1 formylglycine-generating enzyme family protein [Synechococcus sp. Edmonson 11F2]MCP9856241.1 formylglycine-generating enzyme family protein [Synechococcus sp. Cruz-9C9]MCP9863526.1 formylglycine-generating enzyme family protein [Synechococcus sp. Cruz-7E5]MCP9870722.1 formylglycine-generating enzyme fami
MTVAPSTSRSRPGRPPAPGMEWIPGGSFVMGSDAHYPEEAPAHRVRVEGFWIDRSLVTNAQFRKFVKATGHITLAEQPADPAQYPDALPELLVPSSIVFVPPPGPIGTGDPYRWWQYMAGANWRHPEGPGSSIKHRDHHPVVHVAHADAAAYAAWSGKQLPSEAEWERAAWGGREGAEFAWGEELHPGGRPVANTFQGDFPHHNSLLDGYAGTSPVGVFPANGYGLFDTIGNVWEWTDSWYGHHSLKADQEFAAEENSGCCAGSTDAREASIDPTSQHGAMPRKVVKGGSYLCAPSYCRRYRPAARMAQGIDTSTSHMGFRCIVRL